LARWKINIYIKKTSATQINADTLTLVLAPSGGAVAVFKK